MTTVRRPALAALAAPFVTALIVVAGTRLLAAEPPATTAAPADSTSAVARRAVHKLVKDFPAKVDLSTPETALAAICRAFGRKDIRAANELMLCPFEKDIAEEIEHGLKRDPLAPTNLDQTMAGIEIVEVWTYRDDLACVICKPASPTADRPYAMSLLLKVDGKWKGNMPTNLEDTSSTPEETFATVPAAGQYFDKNADILRKSLVEMNGKKIGSSGKPVQARKTTPRANAGTDKFDPRRWMLPDGVTMYESSSGPEIKDELKQLIAAKKYTHVSNFIAPSGEWQRVYRFVLSDGSSTAMSFSMLLDDVTSWDDYQRKRDRQRQRRRDQINQAIAAGRFRLLNIEVMLVHVCRDVQSDKKFKVQRIQRRDGSEIALPRADYGPIPPSVKEASWLEHLGAIRQGTRTLLESETVTSYTYNMTADDGTWITSIFSGPLPNTQAVGR